MADNIIVCRKKKYFSSICTAYFGKKAFPFIFQGAGGNYAYQKKRIFCIMETKAILIVSVGTSHVEALEKTTLKLKEEIQNQYHLPCYTAYSSEFILKRMNQTQKGSYKGIEETLELMYKDGAAEVFIQPTYLLNGIEYEEMLSKINSHRGLFKDIKTAKPLFCEKEDYIAALHRIAEEVKLDSDEALVLIGHGTNHAANCVYQNLEYTAYTQGFRNIFVGTMQGKKSQQMTLRKIAVSGYRKIRLMPLLFAAGYHAKKDIDGGETSWREILENTGCEVLVSLKGLGELKGIRDIFRTHLSAQMENENF